MDIETIQLKAQELFVQVAQWLTSPKFYVQCGLIIVAALAAYSLGKWLISRSPLLKQAPEKDSFLGFKSWFYQIRKLIIPLLMVLFVIR